MWGEGGEVAGGDGEDRGGMNRRGQPGDNHCYQSTRGCPS